MQMYRPKRYLLICHEAQSLLELLKGNLVGAFDLDLRAAAG